jgi:adenylyltransferase/sulfurtransferase
MEAIKLLVHPGDINRQLLAIDLWRNEFKQISVQKDDQCPACGGTYEFLDGTHGVKTTALCGQNAVQVYSTGSGAVSFEALKERLGRVGNVIYNKYLLRFLVDSTEIIVFPDGRAIIKNTNDESYARGLYAKYIGV